MVARGCFKKTRSYQYKTAVARVQATNFVLMVRLEEKYIDVKTFVWYIRKT